MLWSLLFSALLAQAPTPQKNRQKIPPRPPPAVQQPAPLCAGDYADVLPQQQAPAIFESAKQPFVFAVRNTATYEHVYYGRDGKLRRAYLRSVSHGTGFAYKIVGGETFLATNEHVASQPEVTDDDHPVEGVPMGSKKVREQLKIVRDESDDYEPGHVLLSRVLSDPAADIAVLKAKKVLPAMPFRVGRSSQLRAGNLVQVRGFPLGAFAALNTGKVLNPFTEDTEKGWMHADFVIDALLSSGNSGSPVFAVSCRTGEPELVGIYHAGYTEAAALNAVVAIDQLREELDTLKVPKRELALKSEITAQDRDRLVNQLFGEQGHSLAFPFAGRSVVVALVDPTTLRFGVLSEEYPLVMQESMALIDRAQSGFGTLDAISVTVDGVPAEAPVHALDGEVREHFDRLYDSLWKQVLGVVDYRARLSKGRLSADAFEEAQGLRARLRKRVAEQKELLGICAFEAERASFGAAKAAVVAPQAAPRPAQAVPPAQQTQPSQPQASQPVQPQPVQPQPVQPQPVQPQPVQPQPVQPQPVQAQPQPVQPQPDASVPAPNVAGRQ